MARAWKLGMAVAAGLIGHNGLAVALTPAQLESAGFEARSHSPTAARGRAMATLPTGGVLLIPDSTNDRVMAFDPQSGDLLDAEFIPADPVHLNTPVSAIPTADGQAILISDQLNDLVLRYDLSGNYQGIQAPAGGVNNAILDNIRGIALHPDGRLLATVGNGSNAHAVAGFDSSGNYLGNFIGAGSGGLQSPFDLLSQNGYRVSGSESHKIHRYDSNGAPQGDLAAIDSFPEQLATTAGGTLLVANFSGSQEGIVELAADGSLIGHYKPAELSGFRGVYELPNGHLLATTLDGVYEISRSGVLIEAKISGISARYIHHLPAPVVANSAAQPVPAVGFLGLMLLALGLGGLGASAVRPRGAGGR